MAHKPIEKFGVQAEKARVIIVFRNGDRHDAGAQITLNMKKFKNYDQLKAEMTRVVKGFTGPIRTVRTPAGRLVKSMDEFLDGGMYVGCGAEPLNKASFSEKLAKAMTAEAAAAPAAVEEVIEEETHTAAAVEAEPEIEAGGEETEAVEEEEEEEVDEPVAEEQVATPAAAGGEKKLEKFGVQTEKGKVLLLFRNGDKKHKGERLVFHPKKLKTWEQFLAACAIVKGFTGAIRKVMTPAGHRLASFEELEDGGRYICCGAEPLSADKLPESLSAP